MLAQSVETNTSSGPITQKFRAGQLITNSQFEDIYRVLEGDYSHWVPSLLYRNSVVIFLGLEKRQCFFEGDNPLRCYRLQILHETGVYIAGHWETDEYLQTNWHKANMQSSLQTQSLRL